ncbi:MAG: hypothetical protein ILO53_01070 [Clostridia bacterium]|nr:hypothetical protein [Clostridia bacterium]
MNGRQQSSANKLFAAGVTILMVMLLVVLIVTAASLRRNAKGIDDYRTEIVARVGRTSVPRYLFEFFCLEAAKGELSAGVLNGREHFSGSSSGSSSGGSSGQAGSHGSPGIAGNTAKPGADEIKTAALRYTKQYISLLREADNAGITLTAAEERRVDEEIYDLFGAKDRDETILKFYGLYEKEYRTIRLNFLKIDKFLENYAAGAAPSEEYLQNVFETNITVLGGGTGEVVFMNTATLDEATAKLRRDTLARVCDSVNAADEPEKSGVMRSMFDMYNEQGFMDGDMSVTVSGGIAGNYPALFETFIKGETGVCYGIEEKGALFAVLITGKYGLDDVRDSEMMRTLTAVSIKKDYVAGLEENPEYAAVLLPAAERIDYSKFAG